MTAARLTVSVIVSTYNRATYIKEALDSLIQQTRPPDEIVVVDDGSTDNTPDVIASYGSRVRHLHKENGGKSAALNYALELVVSDYVWIFDDDDVALPQALATHLDFLTAHPEYDFSYSPQYVFSGEFSQQEFDARPRPKLPEASGPEFFVRTMESMHSMMQGMLVPRRCYEEVGPFNESFIRAQDNEMVLRLARRFSGGCLNEATFALRMHAGVRGSASTRHSDKDRAQVWQQYRIRMFAGLRDKLSLAEYLPEVSNDAVLTALQERQALAQRFCIMARNDLHDDAIKDYRLWRTALKNDAPTALEKLLLSRGVQIDDMTIAPPRQLLWRLGQVSGRHAGLIKFFARGLYWSMRRELKAHNAANASRIAGLITTLYAGALASGPCGR